MAEYIEREAFRREIDEHRPGRSYEDAWALTILDSIPAADVRPVVRGEWENVELNFMAKCSNCRRYYISRDEKYEFHFCPNCGAMMEES